MRRISTVTALLCLLGSALVTTVPVTTANAVERAAKAVQVTVPTVAAPATRHWPPVTDKECQAPSPAPTSGPKPPPVTITVTGIPGADVSSWEGQIDWVKLGASKQFVIMRHSHASHIDTQFPSYWRSAKQVGVIRGAYIYIDPLDPHPFADQLTNFVNGVRLEKGDLAPIIDLENPCLWVHMSVPDRLAYVLKWVHAFEKVYGVKPIIYMSASFVDKALGGAANAAVLGQYPLWIAGYRVAQPLIPLPWTEYLIWQYAEDATLPGVSMPADGDVAPVSLARLKKHTLRKPAGGNAKVLNKNDLDDGGLTKRK
jgi:lysozyme